MSLPDVPHSAQGVEWFFASRVPELLANSEAAVHGIDGRCLFDISDQATGGGKWVVDFTASPPAVYATTESESDCRFGLSARDLLEMVEDPAAGQVRAWQGRLRLDGDQALLRRVGEVLFPTSDGTRSSYSGYYVSLNRLIPDARLTFMNHGYAEGDEDFDWLAEQDRPWRFSVNLIRRALAGTDIASANVVDVGCGRGGGSDHIARYLNPREVIGVDACADAIRFCENRHRQPNLRFLHGYADRIPVDDASADIVLNVESSHCYPDRRAFLAEVERVLKPGGAFCYADIFQPQELEDTRRLLAQMPGLRVTASSDITAGVARAIDLNRDTLARLLAGAVDAELANERLIRDLIRSINVQMYDHYVSGRWRYHTWRMERTLP